MNESSNTQSLPPINHSVYCPIIGSGSDAVPQDVAERKLVSLFAHNLQALLTLVQHTKSSVTILYPEMSF